MFNRYRKDRRLAALERDVADLQSQMEVVKLSVSDAQGQVNDITADLQGVAAGLQQLSTDIGNVSTTLQTEFNNLEAQIQAAGVTVDTTALKAAADALAPLVSSADNAAKALGTLAPQPPTPAAAEESPAEPAPEAVVEAPAQPVDPDPNPVGEPGNPA